MFRELLTRRLIFSPHLDPCLYFVPLGIFFFNLLKLTPRYNILFTQVRWSIRANRTRSDPRGRVHTFYCTSLELEANETSNVGAQGRAYTGLVLGRFVDEDDSETMCAFLHRQSSWATNITAADLLMHAALLVRPATIRVVSPCRVSRSAAVSFIHLTSIFVSFCPVHEI